MTTYDFLQLCKHYGGGEGKYLAKCPCDCARKRTLHVKAIDGRTLIYCESGCKAIDVLKALNITFDDLKDNRNMSWNTEAELYR